MNFERSILMIFSAPLFLLISISSEAGISVVGGLSHERRVEMGKPPEAIEGEKGKS